MSTNTIYHQSNAVQCRNCLQRGVHLLKHVNCQATSNSTHADNIHQMFFQCRIHIYILEVWGPSGPQLLVGGPACWLDFVLPALWGLRPCDPRNDVVSVRVRWGKKHYERTGGQTNKAILGVGYFSESFVSLISQFAHSATA